MKNWEKQYLSYNKTEEARKINELEKKVQDKSISKEEYNELNKKKNIQANLDKVSHVIELRDKLDLKIEQIKKEIERRNTLRDASKEQEKLEKRLNEILLEEEKLKKQLKDPNLKDEEKKKIAKKLADLNTERDENNKSFSEKQSILMNNAGKAENKLSKISNEELEEQKFDISSKISKCNMVCNNLMKGLTWNSIELKLDNWQEKRFTDPKKIAKKKLDTQKTKNSNKKEDKELDKEAENVKESDKEAENVKESDEEEWLRKKVGEKVKNIKKEKEKENLPAEKGFLGRHPKIKKVIDTIKKLVTRKTPYEAYMKDKYKSKENTGPRKTSEGYKQALRQQQEIVKQKEKEREEKFKQEEKEQTRQIKNNEFKEYLKQVAEKGIDTVEKENDKYQRYKKLKEERMKSNGEQIIHASEGYRKFADEQER